MVWGPVVWDSNRVPPKKKPSDEKAIGLAHFLRESLGATVDGSFEIRRSPVDIP